jgi:hypothetical protein
MMAIVFLMDKAETLFDAILAQNTSQAMALPAGSDNDRLCYSTVMESNQR